MKTQANEEEMELQLGSGHQGVPKRDRHKIKGVKVGEKERKLLKTLACYVNSLRGFRV